MSTTTATRTQQQKTSNSRNHTTLAPTDSMIEAAKVDYATRLFLHTQKQLQQVYSSEDKERKNNKGFSRKDYGEVRDQKVKKMNKRNW